MAEGEARPARTATSPGGATDRFVCIHGHFYQPPRENPWLEEIERQDSAYPYHDWNQRITDECYAANAASRILDEGGLISKITNNYARMSFNFGPTLLAWMERRRPEVLAAIVEADVRSRELFSGHGSAIAQTYNHLIQPLASPRDRRTQVIWGVRDFEHRFGRPPEGMWLPETAVDVDSLEALAEGGIRFTVLAPHQAARVRKIGAKTWQRIDDASPLDTGMPYRAVLPSGLSLAVFFYDGPTSRAVAFDNLLRSGKNFADRLLAPLTSADGPRLMHVATDGETYGHHHRFGDMALAFALEAVVSSGDARLTNYGELLELHPPTHEVEIAENTSWSCAHGIDRWRADCGCRVDSQSGWNQAWRSPLRGALDWLRDELGPLFDQRARAYLEDPWAARDDYIDLVLDRSTDRVARFLETHAHRHLDDRDTVAVLELLEMQRQAMLMYTSCGWFFDDLAGIETIQILCYAGRAIQLAERRGAPRIEASFVDRLAKARSNRPEEGDGAAIYERHVKPIRADLRQVGAHYAISSIFNGHEDSSEVFCYHVRRSDDRRSATGRARLAVGRCRVTSATTRESEEQAFAVVHLGDHNLVAGVRADVPEPAYEDMAAEIGAAFEEGNFPGCFHLLEKHLGPPVYSLQTLFRDQRRAVLSLILDAAVGDVESLLRRLYEQHAPLLQFLETPDHPLSRGLRMAGETTLNSELRRALAVDVADIDRVDEIIARSEKWSLSIDREVIPYLMERVATALAEDLVDDRSGVENRSPVGNGSDIATMKRLQRLVELAARRDFTVNLWRAQNAFYRFMTKQFAEHAATGEDATGAEWVEQARALGKALRVRVE